jgi:uncharacterized protein YecT (DUF1311 family)
MTPQTQRSMPFLAAAAAAVLLVGAGAYSCSKRDNGDKLSDTQVDARSTAGNVAVAAKAPDPARRCATTATYDLLKRELFRRAAQIRGSSDPALFDRIASAAALRVERPLVTSRDEGLGSIACSASAAIDLPPGLAVAGGRTSLSADLAYTLQPAADGSGDVLAFTNGDAIVVPLATIGRTASTARLPTAPPPVLPDPLAPTASPSPPPPVVVHRPAPPLAPPPAPAPAPVVVSRPNASPSFPCARARTQGEIMICGNPGLAAVDRQMAAQYREAYAAASPEAQTVLRTSAHRFYGFRDNCPDARCIAAGYRERMREIDDIMARDR